MNQSKKIKNMTEDELLENPLGMYIYSVNIIQGKLSDRLHNRMKQLAGLNDLYAIGYFNYLNKKNSVWTKIKTFFGLNG